MCPQEVSHFQTVVVEGLVSQLAVYQTGARQIPHGAHAMLLRLRLLNTWQLRGSQGAEKAHIFLDLSISYILAEVTLTMFTPARTRDQALGRESLWGCISLSAPRRASAVEMASNAHRH